MEFLIGCFSESKNIILEKSIGASDDGKGGRNCVQYLQPINSDCDAETIHK